MQGMLSKQVNRSILSTTFLEDILKIESMLTDGIIYFVGVWLETEVHAQGLGLPTSSIIFVGVGQRVKRRNLSGLLS
jgi:hypothetical protein